ncbi:MAG: hypothetical protein K6F94_06530 [Bacteroidaceae bacterium]|nr:hypothetical protein [Bacteroidaceae bacterium]
MDYKYIEQLIDRYFDGETSIEEEQILRKFFAQEELPEHLLKWKPLFLAEHRLAEAHLDASFDNRILALTGEQHVQARRITMSMRMRPLFKAAAFIAFAIVIGTAVEHAAGTAKSYADETAIVEQDELNADETTPIDIKSAEAVESMTDTVLNIPALKPIAQ